MSDKNLTKEELLKKLKESEERNTELEKEKADFENKKAELEKEIARFAEDNAKLKQNGDTKNNGPSELTKKIAAKEAERAKTTKVLFIPEDLDPDSQNTFHCAINGKAYSIPKGKEVEVPLAVYEIYQESVKNEKRVIAAQRGAGKTKKIEE